MSSGLFAVVCPRCGTEISSDPLGRHTCHGCTTSYVIRFGHLLPLAGSRREERFEASAS